MSSTTLTLRYHLSLPISQRHRLRLCNSLPPVFCSLHAMPSLNFIHTRAFTCHLHPAAQTPASLQDASPMCCPVFPVALLECPLVLTRRWQSQTPFPCVVNISHWWHHQPPSHQSGSQMKRRRIIYLSPPSPFPMRSGHLKYYSFFSLASTSSMFFFSYIHFNHYSLLSSHSYPSQTISNTFHSKTLCLELMNICCCYHLYTPWNTKPLPLN